MYSLLLFLAEFNSLISSLRLINNKKGKFFGFRSMFKERLHVNLIIVIFSVCVRKCSIYVCFVVDVSVDVVKNTVIFPYYVYVLQ